jgi:Flp pilus assembly protein TadG
MTVWSLPRLSRDERGAAIIELAMLAPFMAAMVIGMTDLSRAYSMKLQLEQVAQRTIEQVEQQKSVATTYNTALTTEATAAASDAGFTTGNTITPDSWLECGASTTHQTFTDSCTNAGDVTARYVSVSISRSYTPFFSSRHWPGANTQGNIVLTGYAALRMQ